MYYGLKLRYSSRSVRKATQIPMPVVASNINDVVETLCTEGCTAVRLYIRQLEQNNPSELLEGLADKEKAQVLDELRAIMAVYDRCR